MTWLELAFDGWVGAIVSGLVAAGAAILAVAVTLKRDRQRFIEQAELDRERAAAASASARELALDQQRIVAFADVLAEFSAFRMYPYRWKPRLAIEQRLRVATQRWAMYVDPSELEFVKLVEEWIDAVTKRAQAEIREGDAERRWVTMDGEYVRPFRVGDSETQRLVDAITDWGRVWHLVPLRRDEAIAQLIAVRDRNITPVAIKHW